MHSDQRIFSQIIQMHSVASDECIFSEITQMHSDQCIFSKIIMLHSDKQKFIFTYNSNALKPEKIAGQSQAYLWIPPTFPIDLERTPMQGARQPQKIIRIKLQTKTRLDSSTFLLSVPSVKPPLAAALRVWTAGWRGWRWTGTGWTTCSLTSASSPLTTATLAQLVPMTHQLVSIYQGCFWTVIVTPSDKCETNEPSESVTVSLEIKSSYQS